MGPTDMERVIDRELAEFCLRHLAERAERDIPETDRSGMRGMQFLLGDTGIYGVVIFECDDRGYDTRRLLVSAHREWSDRLWSQTFFVGSTAEALAKLRDPQTIDEFIRDVAELAAKVADR